MTAITRVQLTNKLIFATTLLGLALLLTFRTQAQGSQSKTENKKQSSTATHGQSHANSGTEQMDGVTRAQLEKAQQQLEKAQQQLMKQDWAKVETEMAQAKAQLEKAIRSTEFDIAKAEMEKAMVEMEKSLAAQQGKLAIEMKKAEAEIPRSIELGKLKLATLKTENQRANQDIADLESDRALFEIKAPADGYFYHGPIDQGRWTPGKIAETLVLHGHPPRPIGVWDLNPGDAVWPGTAGAGENLCPDCSGEGQYEGQTCHTCGGTGLVMVPVSGGA